MRSLQQNFHRWPYAEILAATRNAVTAEHPQPDNMARVGAALCRAIMRGDNRRAEFLLNAGAPINYRDQPDGWTPLIYSIYYNNPAGRKMLLERGADPAVRDFAGRTTLMFAAISGDVKLTGEMLDRGIPPEAVDYRGKTALDFAEEYYQTDCAALLTAVSGRRGLLKKPALKKATCKGNRWY